MASVAISGLTVGIHAAEPPPRDPSPEFFSQPAFAHEVEVDFRPVMKDEVLGEEMIALLIIKNLSQRTIRLPSDVNTGDTVPALHFALDSSFASEHGIRVRDIDPGGLHAITILRAGATFVAKVRLDHYISFTRPVAPPIPITWRLELRDGEEKGGHFFLNLQVPKDPLDEIMERLRRDQDRDLPGLIEVPEQPVIPHAP